MPWTDEFFEVVGRFVRCATSHGINMLYTPLFTPPLDTHIGGERPDVQLVVVRRKTANTRSTFRFLTVYRRGDRKRSRIFRVQSPYHAVSAKACPKIMAHTENGYEKIFGWETSSTGDDAKISRGVPSRARRIP
ncbi:MAG: glycoside hydrolase domain-containing protein [Christensenellales bacterium]